MDLLAADRVRLTRRDLIRWEHFLKDAVAAVIPHESYSLYFPQLGRPATPIIEGRFDASSGDPLWLPDEGRLLLPLQFRGEVLGVFVARGADPQTASMPAPVLSRIADMVLERLHLYKAAITDAPTGLLAKGPFLRCVERELTLIQSCISPAADTCADPALTPYSARCGVLLVDLDRFRRIVDRYGFVFAEQVMARAADVFRKNCPEQAELCRLADDQFAALLPDLSPRACLEAAEKIRAALAREVFEFPLSGRQFSLSVSAGLACFPGDLRGAEMGSTNEEMARVLVRKARKAASVAKEQGRSRVFSFDQILSGGGSVLEVLPFSRLTVSLGRSVDAQEGMRFLVSTPQTGGDGCVRDGDDRVAARRPAMYKAEIILTEAQEDAAVAEVVGLVDPTWTIEPGDMLTLVGDGGHLEDRQESAPPQKDLLTGLHGPRDFQSAWSRARAGAERFCLVLVRLSAPMGAASPFGEDQRALAERQVRETASVMRDALAAESFGTGSFGGRYSFNSLIWFVPDAEPEALAELLMNVGKIAAESHGVELASGVAAHPCLNFAKTDALENCRKALEHALLLPPPRVARFDSLSLTVSADRHFGRGDVYGAMQEYKLALLADESNTLARNSLGICSARVGRLSEAARIFEEVQALEPENLMAWYNSGYVCLKLGDFERAGAAFARCQELDPGHVFSLVRLGQLAEREADPARAREFYERACARDGGKVLAVRHLARLAIIEGRLGEARELLHQALLLNPYDAPSMLRMATLYLDGDEDPEIAETLARQAAAISPDRRACWEILARALEAGGKAEEAAEVRGRAAGLSGAAGPAEDR